MNIGKANLILRDGKVVGRIMPRKRGQAGYVWTFVKKDQADLQVRVLGEHMLELLAK